MKVSIPAIRERIESCEWPRHVQRLMAKTQGDYDFINAPRAQFMKVLDDAAGDEVPLESLLPDIEDPLWMDRLPHLYGWHRYFVLNLLADARLGEPSIETRASVTTKGDETVGSLRVDGDLSIGPGLLLVCGDLEVSGNLRVKGELLVCGSVTVEGHWFDLDEFMHKIIVGDLSVAEAILCRGQTFVGGDARAAEVLVNNRSWVGFFKVAGDLDAARLVRLNGDDDWLTEVHGEERLTGEAPEDRAAAIAEVFAAHEG